MSFESVGLHELAIRCDVKFTDRTTLEGIQAGDVQCTETVNITYDAGMTGVASTQQVRHELATLGWEMKLINNTWPGRVTCRRHNGVEMHVTSTITATRKQFDEATELAIDLIHNAGYRMDAQDAFGDTCSELSQSLLTQALVRLPLLDVYLHGMQAKREDDTFITWLHSAKFTDLGRRYREGPISTSLRDAIEGEYIRRGVKPPKRPRFGAPKARTEEPSPTDTFGAWLSTATDEQLNKQLEIFVKEHSNPAERERIREELNSRAADNAPSKERSVEEIMDDLAAKGTEREINEILDEGN